MRRPGVSFSRGRLAVLDRALSDGTACRCGFQNPIRKYYISIFYTGLLAMPCFVLLDDLEALLGMSVSKQRVMFAMGYNIGFAINDCSQVAPGSPTIRN